MKPGIVRLLERLASEQNRRSWVAQGALDELARRGRHAWTALLRAAGAVERRRPDGSVEVQYRADEVPVVRRELALEQLPHGTLCGLARALLDDPNQRTERKWRERRTWLVQQAHERTEHAARLLLRQGATETRLAELRAELDARGPVAATHESRREVERLRHEVAEYESTLAYLRAEGVDASREIDRLTGAAAQALANYERALRGEVVPLVDHWVMSAEELRAIVRPLLPTDGVLAQVAIWGAALAALEPRGGPECDEAREQLALWARCATEDVP